MFKLKHLKMKKILPLRFAMLLLSFGVFTFFSCKKEPLTPLDTELDFKLRVLNDKQQEVDISK